MINFRLVSQNACGRASERRLRRRLRGEPIMFRWGKRLNWGRFMGRIRTIILEMQHMRKLWIGLVMMGIWCAEAHPTWAAPAKTGDEEDVRDRLGERFTSRGRGIRFRPPIGGTEIKRT